MRTKFNLTGPLRRVNILSFANSSSLPFKIGDELPLVKIEVPPFRFVDIEAPPSMSVAAILGRISPCSTTSRN